MAKYISSPKVFNIETATREDLKHLGEHVVNFLDILEEVMVIPDKMRGSKKELDAAREMTKKLIKKLKAGNFKAFKDSDEWNI